MPVGHVLQLGDAGAHLLHAVLVEQVQQVALADLAGAVLGVEIALLVGAGAHVGEHEVDHVLAALALFPQLDRRDAQAFGVDLLGVRVVAGRHRAADVGQVALAHGPEHQLALVVHRLVHAAVEDVAALVRWVVVVDHVALGDVVTKKRGHAFHGGNQRAQVDRDVLALQDHFGEMVEQRVRVVMGQVEHTGAAGLFQGQSHFALRCLQRTPDNRKGDRIYCFHRSPTFLLVLLGACRSDRRVVTGYGGSGVADLSVGVLLVALGCTVVWAVSAPTLFSIVWAIDYTPSNRCTSHCPAGPRARRRDQAMSMSTRRG
ncbi:hypothetical protein D3C81_1330800 [compost metagenome]